MPRSSRVPRGDRCDYVPPTVDGYLIAFALEGGTPVYQRRMEVGAAPRADLVMDVASLPDRQGIFVIGHVLRDAVGGARPTFDPKMVGTLHRSQAPA